MPIHNVCVFCGARPGRDPAYLAGAQLLGRLVAARGWGLVFGGGSVGMMGAVADAALAAGGRVEGVIPDFLATAELLHTGCTEMHVVTSMHARKAKMAELSDAFIALPGGLGTLEELFEVATWAQLNLHRRPIGLLNTAGFFEPWRALIEHGISEGFIYAENRELVRLAAEPGELLDQLAQMADRIY